MELYLTIFVTNVAKLMTNCFITNDYKHLLSCPCLLTVNYLLKLS